MCRLYANVFIFGGANKIRSRDDGRVISHFNVSGLSISLRFHNHARLLNIENEIFESLPERSGVEI